jgi:hypothetical protein
MPIAVTVSDQWDDGKRLHVVGALAFSGSYATGGDTLSFVGKVPASRAPILVRVEGIAGYKYEVNLGSAINNSLVLVRQYNYPGGSAGAATEVSAGAYPGGVTGDTQRFYAVFKLL